MKIVKVLIGLGILAALILIFLPTRSLARQVRIQDLTVVAESGLSPAAVVKELQTAQGTYPNHVTQGNIPTVYTNGNTPNGVTSGSSPNVLTRGNYPNTFTTGHLFGANVDAPFPTPKLAL